MLAQFLIRILKAAGDVRAPEHGVFDEARNILIVETTRFGDLLAALPAAERLRSLPRTVSCTLVVNAANASIFDALDPSCAIIPIPWPDHPLRAATILSRIRSQRFDLACSMSPSRKNALVTLASNARCKFGYFTHLTSKTPFLDETTIESVGCGGSRMTVPRGDSLYTRASRIADYAGAPPSGFSPLRLRPSLESRWEKIRGQLALRPIDRIVVVHPFAAWPYRAWPEEYVVQLAGMLKDRGDVLTVVIGSPGDFGAAGGRLRGRLVELGAAVYVSKSWADTALLLSHSSLFIGTDSGPIHLAAALGIPIVGLYGPAAPELTSPPANAGRYLYHRMPCSPCDQMRCVSPTDSCMSRLTPQEVVNALGPDPARTSGVVVNG